MTPVCLQVDFYLYSSHEVAVFEPAWRALRRRGVDAQMVLEPPGVHRATGTVPDATRGWLDDKDDGSVEPLVDRRTFDGMANLLQRCGLPWIERSRVHADAVVTTQGVGWLHPYRGARIKMEYGASAFVDVYGHGTVNRGLDAVLAHGPFSANAIAQQLPSSRIHVVGYPKWAHALRARTSREDARRQLGVASDRPLVAWFPTWAHNATIDRYAEAMADLAGDYTVLAKPHHNSVRFETERLAAIAPAVEVRGDLHTLVELMLAADVVVADGRSGALAESFLADRPAVGLLPGIDARSNGILGGLDDAVLWCRRPEELRAAVACAVADDAGEPARRRWRPWLFADHGGHDDERAADAILRIVADRTDRVSSLSLADLDARLDATPAGDPAALAVLLDTAWPHWPGHPQLLDLIAAAGPALPPEEGLRCARLVRSVGAAEHCPLLAGLGDADGDPVDRLVAAALLAEELEEDTTDRFVALAAGLDEHRFVDALGALDVVPRARPAFVQVAANTPRRCAAMASALERVGAVEQAELVAALGRELVTS